MEEIEKRTEEEITDDLSPVEKDETEIVEEKLVSEPLKPKKESKIGKGAKKFFKWLWRKIVNIFAIKRIDWFILKKFLGTYLMATILMLAVISMFDVTEKLDAFLTAPFSETIFDYFMSFLPYFALMLSPLFVFISVIFFTTKLAGNSEII
ncbi:MAG: LptF/LptG family permease, partial [Muribaculaceae bacterium]|nr:LptF/LptG family permease [Muribaculaceae bacterium]